MTCQDPSIVQDETERVPLRGHLGTEVPGHRLTLIRYVAVSAQARFCQRAQLLRNMQEPEAEPAPRVVWQVDVNNGFRRPLWLDYDRNVSRLIEEWHAGPPSLFAVAPAIVRETLDIGDGWLICRQDGYYWQIRVRRPGSERQVRRVVVSYPLP